MGHYAEEYDAWHEELAKSANKRAEEQVKRQVDQLMSELNISREEAEKIAKARRIMR
jgi:hypothetical protein